MLLWLYRPKKRDFFFLGAFSALKMKSYLIAFYSDEIVLAGLTTTGKFNEQRIHIPKNDIQSIKVKKKELCNIEL